MPYSMPKTQVLINIALTLLIIAATTAQAAYDRDAPMSRTTNGDIEIAYLSVGDEQATPILIVMGLSASHKIWDPALINGLLDGGYRVVLLDNRDTGESSRVEGSGKLWLWWQLLKSQIGLSVNSPYTLADMAGDAVAVLDTLEIEQAHVIGASMGGMIAQIIAYDHPERTKSLTSIMSTTGAPHLPPPGQAQREGIDKMNESSEEEATRLEALGFFTSALPNQVTAIFNAGDRTSKVRQIAVPTLVLHGADDPLLPLAHGEFTAKNITGSTFKVYQGMAHNMPDEVIPTMVGDMLTHLNAVDNP
jgi:pimeloyl-ACP methyl ester carboxylesterase